MAKKKDSNPPPPRKMTKRQLSNYQKQLRRQRFIKWGGFIFIVAAILVIGLGWLFGSYTPEHRTVMTVNGVKLDYRDYVSTLKFYSESTDQLQMMSDLVPDWMEETELVRQAAAELDITVTDDELNESLELYGIEEEFASQVEALLLQQKVWEEHFMPQVPEKGPQQYVYAMFLESKTQANEIRERIIAGENFTGLAAIYTLDTHSLENDGDLGWHKTGIVEGKEYLNSEVVADYLANAEVGVLSQPIADPERTKNIGYWLVKVTERDEEQGIHVFGILCGSEAEAMDVSQRLNSGENFADLAAEISQYSSASDGDIGWLTEDLLEYVPYKDYILNETYPLDSLSYPIKDDTYTSGGYWLIELADRDDDRELSEVDRSILTNELFTEWLENLKTNPDNVIELNLTDEIKQEAINTAIKELTQ